MSLKGLSLVAGLLAIWPGPVQAHDIYANLTNKRGLSCCNRTDCRSAPYRITASGVQMLLDRTWVTIPAASIIYRDLEGDTGETGGGHWCGAYLMFEDTFLTRCAVLPPTSASASDSFQ